MPNEGRPVVLHDDGDVVGVDKPTGEPVIPERGGPADACLRRRLEEHLGRRVLVVHRIDRDASGLVAFAGNAEAHRRLSQAFEHRQVRKTYLAFAAGALPEDSGTLDVALHAARRGKTRPAREDEPGRREATTEYRVRARWRRDDATISLLEVHPLTGRHHQIRVHLRSVGVPLLFDPLYGRGLMPSGLDAAPTRRLALHSLRLDLPTPAGTGRLTLEAPLAADLEALSSWLDGEWTRV